MHPPSNRMPYERNGRATQSRRSRGARRAFFIVASFRTWRGSEVFVARDPNINIAQQFRIIWITALRREFSLARADCEYRAPLAPRLAWPHSSVSARLAMRSMPAQRGTSTAPLDPGGLSVTGTTGHQADDSEPTRASTFRTVASRKGSRPCRRSRSSDVARFAGRVARVRPIEQLRLGR